MKTLIVGLVALCVAAAFAQTDNYNGWKDTSQIATFKADSLKYSKVFLLSQNENLRVDILANDTSSAGFKSDSMKLYWGIQLGHPTLNGTAGSIDTFWSPEHIMADTFDLTTTTNAAVAYRGIDSTGAYTNRPFLHDTLSVSGYAVQSRNIRPDWDVFFRVWIKGLTKNNVKEFVLARVAVYRRIGTNTRSR